MKKFNTAANGVNKYMDLTSRGFVPITVQNSSARGTKSVL